jgi:hypothetical protein
MRLILFFFLLIQVSCATKYIIPGNRFMTPESQGGALRGQFEFQQSTANQMTANLENSSVDDGVNNASVVRSGFLYSTSLFDQFDVFWAHTGGGNSLLGGKYQFLGASRTGNGTGHKMAVALGFGANDYETEGNPSVEFELGGKEFQFLYGFRFGEMVLAYANLSYATYKFDGIVSSSDSRIDGLKPSYQTKAIGLLGGLEFDLGIFFAKLECGYQQLQTTDTKDFTNLLYGYSVGASW